MQSSDVLQYRRWYIPFCFLPSVTSRFPVAVRRFSNKSQKTSKYCKNIYRSSGNFLFLPHFDIICDLLLNRRTATWNLFLTLWFYIDLTDGQRILSCGADHFMRVLDVHTGTEVYSKDVGEEIRCVGHF